MLNIYKNISLACIKLHTANPKHTQKNTSFQICKNIKNALQNKAFSLYYTKIPTQIGFYL